MSSRTPRAGITVLSGNPWDRRSCILAARTRGIGESLDLPNEDRARRGGQNKGLGPAIAGTHRCKIKACRTARPPPAAARTDGLAHVCELNRIFGLLA
jgi:hypothetical protein